DRILIDEPAQRTIDLAHLGEVEGIAEPAVGRELGLGQRHGGLARQARPLGSVDLDERAQGIVPDERLRVGAEVESARCGSARCGSARGGVARGGFAHVALSGPVGWNIEGAARRVRSSSPLLSLSVFALHRATKLASMCGIVGYVGPNDTVDVLVSGLARLEYRGYDSAGIAVQAPEGGIEVRKRSG